MNRIAWVAALAVLVGACGAHQSRVSSAAPSSTSSASSTTTTHAPVDCPAASLTVSGAGRERLHAAWLPPGLVLTGNNETDLGAQGGPSYFKLGGADPPFVTLSRFHSTEPLASLIVAGVGTTQPVEVQGHPGAETDAGLGPPPTIAIGWTFAPGIELRVQAHGITNAQALEVANAVQYTPATPFTYPTNARVTVTREQALSALGSASSDDHAALTSFGELTAMRSHEANHRAAIAPDVMVSEAVWVAWTAGATGKADRAVVVDARSGGTIANIAGVDSNALDRLTDRSASGCTPPWGVLTRSEATYLQPPASGGTVTMKLSTEGTLGKIPALAFLGNCPVQECDPTVPVWLIVFSAPDQRYLHSGLAVGPTGRTGASGPTTTPIAPGSWEVTGFDARTGPQDTSMSGGTLSSPGSPPPDLLAVRDLSPGA